MSKISSGATEVDLSSNTEGLLATDVAPELERQLASAKDNEPVEAVLVLRQRSAEWPHPFDPAGLLKRVCGNEPAGTVGRTILPRLGVLIVRAHAHLIRQLIAQPAVAIASANRIEGTVEAEPMRF
ncbi:MAG TPA: hypothetical protein VFO07_01025 [Roseiflexaceae bacterium]|nr:hypothetical protein [Roseiflexaceae bacterium]